MHTIIVLNEESGFKNLPEAGPVIIMTKKDIPVPIEVMGNIMKNKQLDVSFCYFDDVSNDVEMAFVGGTIAKDIGDDIKFMMFGNGKSWTRSYQGTNGTKHAFDFSYYSPGKKAEPTPTPKTKNETSKNIPASVIDEESEIEELPEDEHLEYPKEVKDRLLAILKSTNVKVDDEMVGIIVGAVSDSITSLSVESELRMQATKFNRIDMDEKTIAMAITPYYTELRKLLATSYM